MLRVAVDRDAPADAGSPPPAFTLPSRSPRGRARARRRVARSRGFFREPALKTARSPTCVASTCRVLYAAVAHTDYGAGRGLPGTETYTDRDAAEQRHAYAHGDEGWWRADGRHGGARARRAASRGSRTTSSSASSPSTSASSVGSPRRSSRAGSSKSRPCPWRTARGSPGARRSRRSGRASRRSCPAIATEASATRRGSSTRAPSWCTCPSGSSRRGTRRTRRRCVSS